MTPSAAHGSSQDDRVDQMMAEYLKSVEDGQPLDRQELLAQHPDLAGELTAFFADRDRFEQAAGRLRAETAGGAGTCRYSWEVAKSWISFTSAGVSCWGDSLGQEERSSRKHCRGRFQR